jgi:hypothetical protein
VKLERNDRFTLVEALDRLIDKGVSVSGDVSISVADIDLVYVGLRLLLCSADQVPGLRSICAKPPVQTLSSTDAPASGELDCPAADAALISSPSALQDKARTTAPEPPRRSRDIIDVSADQSSGTEATRLVDIDPAQVERDLCRLVLTIVELLRQLMERQAVRRMEGGSLNDEEVERLGMAFARLNDKMVELRAVFGLDSEDLNIDLGPLGTLV